MIFKNIKSSIRKFLLVNLLIAITITTTLTAIGDYYLDQKDIQQHLDTLMSLSALSYQALQGDDLNRRPIEEIQAKLNNIPKQVEEYEIPLFINTLEAETFIDKFHYQVWSNKGDLLLHSAHAPLLPLYGETNGFSDQTLQDEKWRVFTTFNPKTGAKTVVGERYNARNELSERIAQDDMYIMLLTFPLSGLLIWLIIGRGLASLDKVAKEVANRAPNRLEPVNIEEVPEEIKPVIDELNSLFFRLKEGFEREKRFTADAAHELRTPLAALKAQAQVALNSKDLAAKDEALSKVIEGVNRSTHIVSQLLTLSRLVPEATLNEQERVKLDRVARDVIAMLIPNALERGIDVEFEAPSRVKSFKGNKTAIEILIRNLVDNAIRYCNDKGKVLVSVYHKPQEVVLEIRDNGPGIPDALRTRVFERFYRVVGNKMPGSGLGLGIVQQIVHLHQARIELDKPDVGTGLIVRVYFALDKRLNA